MTATANSSSSSLSAPWRACKRSLETLTVLCTFAIFPLAAFGPLMVLYVFLYTKYLFLAVAYITWIIYDRNIGKEGGRKSSFYTHLPIWKNLTNYFPIRLIKTAELDPLKNYLLGYHPHGICAIGHLGNFIAEVHNFSQNFPEIKTNFLTLNVCLYIPIFREFILAAGGCSVAEESMNFLLSKKGGGNAYVIIPGGAREIFVLVLDTIPGTNTIYLNKRKGFIRLAIKNGSPVVPMYSFGENDVFELIDNPEGSRYRKFQEKCMNLFGIFPIIPTPKSHIFGILPRRRPITTVVGAPIEVEHMENPTEEYIDQVHEKYINELIALFYANREKCGHPNAELKIK